MAATAYELQRVAGDVQQRASGDEAVTELPTALAHVEEAVDRLSTAVVKLATAIEDWEPAIDEDGSTLSPSARALRWHLFHVAARMRGVRDACPEARRWAHELLRESELPIEQ